MIVREPRWHGEFLPPGAAGLYRSPVGMVRGGAVALRGLGRLGATAADCGTILLGAGYWPFAPGLATQPSLLSACFCLKFPFMCSTSAYQAAQALLNPDLVYGSGGPPAPVAPPAVGAGTSTVPAPYTADQAQAAIDASLAAGSAQSNANTQSYFDQVSGNLDAIAAGQSSVTGGVPMWAWVLGGGALVLFAASAVRR